METKEQKIERLKSIIDRQIHRLAYLITSEDDDADADIDKCLAIKNKAKRELKEMEDVKNN